MAGPEDKSTMQTARELWELVVAYFKQETIEPLKGLVRFLLWGTIGSFCLGIGSVLMLLALLRAIQTETGDALDGNLSFLPYVIVLIVAGAIAGAAASRIGAEKRKTEGAS